MKAICILNHLSGESRGRRKEKKKEVRCHGDPIQAGAQRLFDATGRGFWGGGGEQRWWWREEEELSAEDPAARPPVSPSAGAHNLFLSVFLSFNSGASHTNQCVLHNRWLESFLPWKRDSQRFHAPLLQQDYATPRFRPAIDGELARQ